MAGPIWMPQPGHTSETVVDSLGGVFGLVDCDILNWIFTPVVKDGSGLIRAPEDGMISTFPAAERFT